MDIYLSEYISVIRNRSRLATAANHKLTDFIDKSLYIKKNTKNKSSIRTRKRILSLFIQPA